MKITSRSSFITMTAAAFAMLVLPTSASATDEGDRANAPRPAFSIGEQTFGTWSDYYASQYFQENGKRCGKPATVQPRSVDPSDCTSGFTNPSSDYVPGAVYQIPVVVHIIEHSNGDGQISDALVHSQIDVLNEDFRALAGTLGATGYDSGIEFVLATTDPGGNPTTGITRTVNNNWHNDSGSYWNTLAWDTAEYMNIYTNNADGNLGYVPDLPQGGLAGNNEDRIVILWSAFGRNSVGGPPYDQGRTATHEVGHYLGLEHTFTDGCAAATPPACYSSGDLICDTNSEKDSASGCPNGASSCGTPDPIENYMDYSDDTCMELFTIEQALRMRCSLLNYRADLWGPAAPPVCGNDVTESGEECDGTSDAACPSLCQIDCTCPAPVCGNAVTESGEECDGSSDTACPSLCQIDCTCPAPVCGNQTTESGEECDGSDDAACPGLCEGGCSCPITCNIGDLFISRAKSDIKRFVWKGELDNFSGTYDGADPRNEFVFYVVQEPNSVIVDIPALDPGWERSKPEKGRYKWKGLLGGIKRITLIDKTLKKGIWKVRVVGKEVPGAELIDVITEFADIEMTIDGICGGGTY